MLPSSAVHVALLTPVAHPALEVRNISPHRITDIVVALFDAESAVRRGDLLASHEWWGLLPGTAVEFALRAEAPATLEVRLSWSDAAGDRQQYQCIIERESHLAEAPCTLPAGAAGT